MATARKIGLTFLAVLVVATSLGAEAGESASFQTVTMPAPGPARAIGSYTNGCISGAVPLAADGPGHQVIRLSRKRYFGHPEMIDYLTALSRKIARAQLGLALIGDIGQPMGGAMIKGHASHQIGLDADIWFRLDLPALTVARRESLEEVSMVDPSSLQVRPGLWTEKQITLLRLAAEDSRVTRIFVNPAIKLDLCRRSWPDRRWLARLRPWYGHSAHFHIRLDCPPGSALCEPQRPVAEGDGCDQDLKGWLAELRRDQKKPPPPPSNTPRERPPMPPLCQVLIAQGQLPVGP